MAKKKLTPFEKAQRQFVQARLAETGLEASPETRQRFRQRFENLASEKQGRTKIAQKLLPTGTPEERKNFKRMLATDLPPRRDLGTQSPTGYTPQQIAQMRAAASTMGPQLSMVMGPRLSDIVKPPATTKTAGKATQKSSSLVDKFRSGLISVVPGLSDVDKSKREFAKGNIVGGVGRLVLGTAQTAATVGSIFLSGGTSATALGTTTVTRSATPTLTKSAIQAARNAAKIKVPTRGAGGPIRPSSPVSAVANAGKSTALPKTTLRLNAKGGYGGKSYGPQVPAATKPAATKPAATKPATTKPATSKPASTKPSSRISETLKGGDTKPASTKPASKKPASTKPASKKPAKTSKADAEDLAYQAAQIKNRFPGATEKDTKFIDYLTRAQQAIENKSPGYEAYANWLKNPQTQATLRRLRGN